MALSGMLNPLWTLSPQCGPLFAFEFLIRHSAEMQWVFPEDLRNTVSTLSVQRAQEISFPLSIAMTEAEIDTPLRKAAFIAQLAHESAAFKTVVEFGNEKYFTKLYEGRKDLGNTQPGDGARYKGRGFIQLTGRANYAAAGKDLGLDLESYPELVEQDLILAARVSAWFWRKKKLNRFADGDDIEGLTRAINGGKNGLPQRKAYYAKAKVVFGVTLVPRAR